jgi:ABC-2 type transport system ATP-binding protein
VRDRQPPNTHEWGAFTRSHPQLTSSYATDTSFGTPHGQTIVLITHDMEEADKLSERIAIIDHGHLLALDTPAELKRSVHADTVVKVAGDVDPAELAAQLQAELANVRDAHVLEDAVLLTLGPDGAVLPPLVDAAARRNIRLRDVRIEEPTLETIFIGLTGKELRD